MQQQQKVQQHWVRRMEHGVLRLVSLFFSLASAHAIRWFFAPLDRVDILQPIITWVVAIGFGLLGYFVSRGLAHRLMNRERVRAYLPIVIVVEVVEVVCNYALAAGVIQQATWLETIPAGQRSLLTGATYMVLSIIPLVSVLLAVVDMDLERKQGDAGSSLVRLGGAGPASPRVPPRTSASPQNGASAYGRGYQGNTAGAGSDQNGRPGQGGFKFPFAKRENGAQAAPQPKDSPSSVRNMTYDPEKELVMP
jgi:hypothetical protein